MILLILAACTAGMLIGISRQINGRLSLSTSPLIASAWSHATGLVMLTALGISLGGLFPPGIADAPWYAYLGGPLSVLYVVGGSWAIVRIGAVNTALLVVGGQMVSGVALDMYFAAPTPFWAMGAGVASILAGVTLIQQR